MSIVNKILLEANGFNFSNEKHHNYDFIMCKYNNQDAGYLSYIILSPEEGYPDLDSEDQQHMAGTFTGHGFYELEEIMPKEKYLDLINNNKFALLETIKVNPKFQNLGIGENLIKKAFNEFKSKGAKSVFLHAEEIDNKKLNYLTKFYSKFGFSEIKNYDGESSLMYKKL